MRHHNAGIRPEVRSEYFLENSYSFHGALLFSPSLAVDYDWKQFNEPGFLFDFLEHFSQVVDILVIVLVHTW
jgi:hypothetical protein